MHSESEVEKSFDHSLQVVLLREVKVQYSKNEKYASK